MVVRLGRALFWVSLAIGSYLEVGAAYWAYVGLTHEQKMIATAFALLGLVSVGVGRLVQYVLANE